MSKPICIIDDCEMEAHTHARGWCINHDRRWRKYGNPLGGRAGRAAPSAADCVVEGCEDPAKTRGWCIRHYTRWHQHGDPLFLHRPDPMEALAYYRTNLMLRQVECKLWPYSKTSGGYGRLQIAGERFIVSRLACEAFNGPPPDPTWEAAHGTHRRCISTLCWNGDHLSWQPHSANMATQQRDGTRPRGEEVVQSKLTTADVLAIRRRREAGESRITLAAAYGVHVEHIGLITTRRSWKHV